MNLLTTKEMIFKTVNEIMSYVAIAIMWISTLVMLAMLS
jgi:hypothetical protein